ncbi:MAG TPA: segregation and condensation protein A [Gammaproteobacteria bacterium]|nr:segregation and condensation protein A [Gammaproteobacteria bacterium]
MSEPELTTEERVLRMMKNVLTSVARDTAPHPGYKHPLSERTIQSIRECLMLIVSREQELGKQHGRDMNARPRYIDEPESEVVVSLDTGSTRPGDRKDSKG